MTLSSISDWPSSSPQPETVDLAHLGGLEMGAMHTVVKSGFSGQTTRTLRGEVYSLVFFNP